MEHNGKMKNVLKEKRTKSTNIYYLSRVAILAALSAILFIFLVPPIPMFAPWLTIDFSDVPAVIAGFSMGPLAGVLTEAIKVILKMIIRADMFTPVGEIANFLVGCAFIIPASIIYKRKHSFKRALFGLSTGFISFVFFSAIINWLFIIPAYALISSKNPLMTIFTTPPDLLYTRIQEGINGIFGYAVSAGFRSISNLSSYIFLACIPFNAIKGVVIAVLTVLIYKRVSPFLKMHERQKPNA